MDRRRFLHGAAALTILPLGTAGAEPPNDIRYAADFDELWSTLDARFCFFADKRTDWRAVRALYRPMALAAETDDAFGEVVRRVLAELYDTHTHPSDPADGTPRWPPYDLLMERRGDTAVVVATKDDSAASLAEVRTGDVVAAVDGVPVERAAQALRPRCLRGADPAADAHALNTAVAGRRGLARRLTVASGGAPPRDVALPLHTRARQEDVSWRRLDGGLGLIAIRSFADDAAATAFDRALLELRDCAGLILDVRDNGGGDTAVARPIMGRFITATKPYATMRRRQGAGLGGFWTEFVEPAGPFTYTQPVVVLTNRWSGSMAEGFPMGMRAIGRATIVGTPMMGLGAAVIPLRLDRTGIAAQYSAEPVYDPQHRPRWLMRPDVAVRDGDDILAAGIRTLRAQLG